jgi:double zinc ribbon protein
MALAIFGINNDFVNLAVSLLVLMFVVVWFALIVYTYMDAKRRIEDPVLVACATAASLFPYIGTAVYSILRPPDFIEDVHERELEIKAAELRVRQLSELSCENCGFPVEKNYLRCPSCQRRLKDPCTSCGQPVDPRWSLCPYCESALPGRGSSEPSGKPEPKQRKRREEPDRRSKSEARSGRDAPSPDATRAARKEAEAQEEREVRRAKRDKVEGSEKANSDEPDSGRRSGRRSSRSASRSGSSSSRRSGDESDD